MVVGVLDDGSRMLAAVCFDGLLAEFVRVVVGLPVDEGRVLQEGLLVRVGSHEFGEGDVLGLDLVEGGVALQDALL